MPTDRQETPPETYFAPATRSSAIDLSRDIDLINHNPIISAVMTNVSGLLAVLNENREIVSVNDVLLRALNINGDALGLRLGEAIGCVHAHDHRGGCGTSMACVTCGAAIAMVVGLGKGQPSQRDCCVTVEHNGGQSDYYFRVQANPVEMEGRRFILLMLTDITVAQRLKGLERAFFHDIGNLIGALMLGVSTMSRLDDVDSMKERAARLEQIVRRLSQEVEVQKLLVYSESADYEPAMETVILSELDLETTLAATSLHIEPLPPVRICTDVTLLQRVLRNMVVNALEASEDGDTVRLWAEPDEECITFCVWNRQPIPPSVAPRIFQRNFSTKGGTGRGLGTFIMKLLGETYLGGTVSFTTSEAEGTVFRLRLPLQRSNNHSSAVS